MEKQSGSKCVPWWDCCRCGCGDRIRKGNAGKVSQIRSTVRGYFADRKELTAFIHDPFKVGEKDRVLGSILNETNLRRVLTVMLDEKEFLSHFGIRAISQIHRDHPYVYRVGDQEHKVSYLPGESGNGIFGGNSNWRRPIWMPVNMLIFRALIHYYMYYGDSFTIECPTGSGKQMNLYYEYYHGDTGRGVGANHQTGWSGVIAVIMHIFETLKARELLQKSRAQSAGTEPQKAAIV